MAEEATKLEATEEKKTVKAKDPWKDMKKILIPRSTDGSANYEIASVNGRVFKIKKGVQVEVPAPIAEVIENKFRAEEEALTYMDKIEER